jgi:hypothetical protein
MAEVNKSRFDCWRSHVTTAGFGVAQPVSPPPYATTKATPDKIIPLLTR